MSSGSGRRPSEREYRALAELRYRIRCFLEWSGGRARVAGLEPQHHQALLALKGLPTGRVPTVRTLSERLQIRHHSAVGLIDRLVARGLVRRSPGRDDRREVLVRLTRKGEAVLRTLSVTHLAELSSMAPSLGRALRALVAPSSSPPSRPRGAPNDQRPRRRPS